MVDLKVSPEGEGFNPTIQTINSILESTDKSDKAIIDKLISEKVQLFNSTVFDNVVDMPASSESKKTSKNAA